MSKYRRPHPVTDSASAATRLLEARSALIDLIFRAPGRPAGELAVEIRNAIETLEAAAENYGAVRDDVPPAPPVSPEELAEVRRAVDERSAELEAARRTK